jgi:hypothetical protein
VIESDERTAQRALPTGICLRLAMAAALVCLLAAAQSQAADGSKAASPLGAAWAQDALSFDPFALTIVRNATLDSRDSFLLVGWQWTRVRDLRAALRAQASQRDLVMRSVVTGIDDMGPSGLPFLAETEGLPSSKAKTTATPVVVSPSSGSLEVLGSPRVSAEPAATSAEPSPVADPPASRLETLASPSGGADSTEAPPGGGDRPPIRVPYRPPLRSPWRPPLR